MLVPVSSRLHCLSSYVLVSPWHSEVSTCFQLPNWHDVILSSNFITKLQILTQKMKLRMTKMSVWKMETSIYRPTCRDHWPRHEDRTTFICYFCEYFCRLVSFTFCEVQMLLNVFYRHSGRGAGDAGSSSRQLDLQNMIILRANKENESLFVVSRVLWTPSSFCKQYHWVF